MVSLPRKSSSDPRQAALPHFRVGDLVVSRSESYPTLCQVIALTPDGYVRLRGLDWPPGYTALVPAGDVRPVSVLRQ